jgi:uncharacterized protein YkwD
VTRGTHDSNRHAVQRLALLLSIILVSLGGLSARASAATVTGAVPVLDGEERKMVALINNYRVANGQSALQLSISLTKSSAWMSKDLTNLADLSHTDSLGRDPFVRMAAFGYTMSGHKGENVAGGYDDAASTFAQWKNSPHHNENMLSANYRVMGIARAYKAGSPYESYWTNDFGSAIDATFTVEGQSVAEPVEQPIPVPHPIVEGTVRSAYVALSPQRIVDTRGEGAPVAADTTMSRPVLGQGGIPTSGVAAVVLTVTITQAKADGFVTVYPTGVGRPTSSSLNVTQSAGTVANLVTIPVTSTGEVSFYTSGGGHIIADVAGYYATVGDTSQSGRFAPVGPKRLLDTRSGIPVAPHGRRIVHVLGQGGVPATGVSAVSLNVTVTGATNAGFVTVFPATEALPTASNLNVTAAFQTVAGAAIVPVDANGDIAVYVDGGGHLLVDINGWFTDQTAPASSVGLFVPQTSSRTLDTRAYHALRAGSNTAVGAPTIVIAVSTNLTMTGAKSAGFLTAWPSDATMPTVSSLNAPGPGATVANHAIIPTSANGVRFSPSGTADLLVDIDGWYLG